MSHSIARTSRSAGDTADAYSALHPASLALDDIFAHRGTVARTTVVLPDARPSAVFAGVRTALRVATRVSSLRTQPLRVVSLTGLSRRERSTTLDYIRREFAFEEYLRVDDVVSARGDGSHPDDIWIATHYSTAHALRVQSEMGRLLPAQVIYLIQDYEPSFLAASSEQSIAERTYHAGFTSLVNSSPVAHALEVHQGIEIAPRHVFAPELDFTRLRSAEQHRLDRRASDNRTVLFYARPGKPRNMFALGLASLHIASTKLRDAGSAQPTYLAIGENISDIALAGGGRLKSVGKLAWDDYFKLLGDSEVMFSLQATAHPSHPPLDMTWSGGLAVTNEVDGYRASLHPRMLTAAPDPALLAGRLVHALGEPPAAPMTGDLLGTRLGSPLDDAIDSVLSALP